MNKKLLALFGLKFNPFSPEVPASALWASDAIQSFCWRIEYQIGEGGFALVSGDPGVGKSVALRLLHQRLGDIPDLVSGVLSRPQASLADFYRELGHLFGVPLSPHNRWNSAKMLREKWLTHQETTLHRPVLLVDEAQEMNPSVFSELRLLASADLDSRSILTTVLAGDNRLVNRLQSTDLLPIASRVRTRLRIDALPVDQLRQCLLHLLKSAGNPGLIAPPLIQTLCEHAMGNARLLTNMAGELLAEAQRRELDGIDEKLFFEVFNPSAKPSKKR
jgi:type II secretory pathway predicted ATPase ExeA